MKSATDLSEALAGAVERAGTSVVRVEASGCRSGSGFAWDESGIVVTAARAVCDEERVRVGLADGTEVDAEVVGSDAGTDVAVLRIPKEKAPPTLVVRDASTLRVGEIALALGRPGRSVRASLRIVGVLGPEMQTPWGGSLDRYVETDRGFPRGFAGGPLVDIEGRAVGLNTVALFRGADVTVPFATLSRVVGDVLAHGGVRRGYLGVSVQSVRVPPKAGAGVERGALVIGVEDGGPADGAGVIVGDVLLSVDGTPTPGGRALAGALCDKPGAKVTLRLLRAGAVTALDVTLGEKT
jgi:S1-C subfamily serine protease